MVKYISKSLVIPWTKEAEEKHYHDVMEHKDDFRPVILPNWELLMEGAGKRKGKIITWDRVTKLK